MRCVFLSTSTYICRAIAKGNTFLFEPPLRRVSFDGFINYEGRRFGVPCNYPGKTARVSRDGDTLYIFSTDTGTVLAEHDVTWSRRDSFCEAHKQHEPTKRLSSSDRRRPTVSSFSVLSYPADGVIFVPSKGRSCSHEYYTDLL